GFGEAKTVCNEDEAVRRSSNSHDSRVTRQEEDNAAGPHPLAGDPSHLCTSLQGRPMPPKMTVKAKRRTS
ncbi:hypothetical protein KI387_041505, partial [Taxus chinensis]